MAVPKFRSSKARTRRKHSINSKLTLPKLVKSKESGDMILPHRIDKATGMYGDRQIIDK